MTPVARSRRPREQTGAERPSLGSRQGGRHAEADEVDQGVACTESPLIRRASLHGLAQCGRPLQSKTIRPEQRLSGRRGRRRGMGEVQAEQRASALSASTGWPGPRRRRAWASGLPAAASACANPTTPSGGPPPRLSSGASIWPGEHQLSPHPDRPACRSHTNVRSGKITGCGGHGCPRGHLLEHGLNRNSRSGRPPHGSRVARRPRPRCRAQGCRC